MDIVLPPIDLGSIAPELIVTGTALVVLLVDLFLPKHRREGLAYLSLLGLALAFGFSLFLWGKGRSAFKESISLDPYSLFFTSLFLFITFLTILISKGYLEREEIQRGEYYALLLFATLGMMLLAKGMDLVVLFLGLETFSIPLYILAGFMRTRLQSNESALKYLLLGAFSSGFLLYGIAFIDGATGSTNLKRVIEFLGREGTLTDPFLFIGASLLIVGFGFKVATVPFHMWAPDVYEGAPTSVTAFMIAGTKAAAFSAFLRVFLYSLNPLKPDWSAVLWILAILTMTLGNVVAIAQRNIKRMLAYSSIAHAGYILVAVVAGGELGASSILFYLLAYAFMNLGAFSVVILLGQKGEENLNLSDYAGVGYRHPLASLAMAIFMFSLAGIPPTAGFMGKFYIFSAAVKAGYLDLAIIGVLNSVVSVFFYLRVIVMMYMQEPGPERVLGYASPALAIAMIVAVWGTFQLGLFPGPFLELALRSVRPLLGIL